MEILINKLEHGENLDLPKYQTEESAGFDLMAAIDDAISIKPGMRALIPTGISISIPKGYEAQIRPRSGLAYKHGITILNAPGTIDSDYRGEIKALLINHGDEDFVITRGMRIAQMVIARHEQALIKEVELLETTARGSGGFGSTGL